MFISSKDIDKQACCDSQVSETSFRTERLEKLGFKLDNWDYVIALAGNPNTGKSTVFNSLTGLRQHTGNWPGKTVSRSEGGYKYQGSQYKLVDLPGTYSLLSASEDEAIARNFVLFAQPDVTVVVVDATRLERNLNLVLQILEITGNVVICLNLMDEAGRKGISIDIEKLEKELGVPVIPTSARYDEGLEDLLRAAAKVAVVPVKSKQFRLRSEAKEMVEAIDDIERDLSKLYPDLPNTRWLALRLLDEDETIAEALSSGELLKLTQRYREEPLDLGRELERINKEQGISYA